MASESESEKRETLADIVAEMRTRSREVKEAFGGRPDGVENMLDIWAGRIEAVAKRERAIHAMTCEANERLREHLEIALEDNERPVGNMAAIREALERMTDWMEKHTALFSVQVCPRQDDPDEVERLRDEAISRARAALSAPARNCDLYKTAREAEKAFDDFCLESLHGKCKPGDCKLPRNTGAGSCLLAWLFAPAAERKGEDYGK